MEEYLDAREEVAWDVWQELADTSRTPPKILRCLREKNKWYLDILLVNLRDCPKDILESLAHLPVQKTHNLKDKSGEVREIARKRLGLEPLIENGSAK